MNNPLFKCVVVCFLAILVVVVNVGCDTSDTEALYVLEQLEKPGELTADIKFQDEVLVSSIDVPTLQKSVSLTQDRSESEKLIRIHLDQQERIKCLRDEIDKAYSENTDLRCSGVTLVKNISTNSLVGVSEISEYLSSNKDPEDQRVFLNDYIDTWVWVGKIDRIEHGLQQMKRSQSVPLFGIFIRKMHNFPIMYEGETLVPAEDANDLMERYHLSKTAEGKRQLAIDYVQD